MGDESRIIWPRGSIEPQSECTEWVWKAKAVVRGVKCKQDTKKGWKGNLGKCGYDSQTNTKNIQTRSMGSEMDCKMAELWSSEGYSQWHESSYRPVSSGVPQVLRPILSKDWFRFLASDWMVSI